VVFDGAAVGAAAAGAAAFGIGEAAGAALGAATTLLMRPDAAATAAAATAAAAAGSAAWQPDDREAPATQCAVCWNAHVRVLLLPCAHLCICAACDAGLVRRLCPLCREPISASINARFP
jgi:E3 ubiquitin-protein ligase BOI-like protein